MAAISRSRSPASRMAGLKPCLLSPASELGVGGVAVVSDPVRIGTVGSGTGGFAVGPGVIGSLLS
jgi:hypothetical protein